MNTTSKLRSSAVALAVVVAAACSGNPEPGAGVEPGTIVVDALGSTFPPVTVYLVTDTGMRDRLGTISGGQERTFTADPSVALDYRLVADMGLRELVSQTFTFVAGDVVEWDLNANMVSRVGMADR